ncbi:hypothetical protein [Chrysiogenes arsenatis]|uniref:hypothetical protein n=1 Tax=Chrysiogenes arsenatis TaxID=309797 RepID=UPI0004052C8B|nr:hypothetical protein [Chrysiogenes arsenatis]
MKSIALLMCLACITVLGGCAGKIYSGDNAKVRVHEYISMYPSVTRDFKEHSLAIINFKPSREVRFSGRFLALAVEKAFHTERLFFRVEELDYNDWFALTPNANEEREVVNAIEYARKERFKYIIVGHVRSFVEANNDALIDTAIRLIRTSDGMTLWYGDVAAVGQFNAGLFDAIYPALSETAPNMSELAYRIGRETAKRVHDMYTPKVPESAKPLPQRFIDRYLDDHGQWK